MADAMLLLHRLVLLLNRWEVLILLLPPPLLCLCFAGEAHG
jgi:hypothetical protein